MLDQRNPKIGPTVSPRSPEQEFPGVERELVPAADHGEKSYRGSDRLRGLNAIITGGDSGMGRAISIAFAREGADVAIGYEAHKEDEDADETKRWVEEAGRRCYVERFEVRDEDECRDFTERAVEELGGLDVLCNHAGYQMSQPSIEEIDEAQLDRTFRTNIYSFFHMTKAALPHLDEGDVIINTGSVTALSPTPYLLDYAATKGAIHVFTQSLAAGLAERGIRVNCVAPGPVWTPFIPASFPKEHVEEFGRDTYWKRPAQPAELAPAWVYLASAESRYMTGEIVAITGSSTTR